MFKCLKKFFDIIQFTPNYKYNIIRTFLRRFLNIEQLI